MPSIAGQGQGRAHSEPAWSGRSAPRSAGPMAGPADDRHDRDLATAAHLAYAGVHPAREHLGWPHGVAAAGAKQSEAEQSDSDRDAVSARATRACSATLAARRGAAKGEAHLRRGAQGRVVTRSGQVRPVRSADKAQPRSSRAAVPCAAPSPGPPLINDTHNATCSRGITPPSAGPHLSITARRCWGAGLERNEGARRGHPLSRRTGGWPGQAGPSLTPGQ